MLTGAIAPVVHSIVQASNGLLAVIRVTAVCFTLRMTAYITLYFTTTNVPADTSRFFGNLSSIRLMRKTRLAGYIATHHLGQYHYYHRREAALL